MFPSISLCMFFIWSFLGLVISAIILSSQIKRAAPITMPAVLTAVSRVLSVPSARVPWATSWVTTQKHARTSMNVILQVCVVNTASTREDPSDVTVRMDTRWRLMDAHARLQVGVSSLTVLRSVLWYSKILQQFSLLCTL